MQRTSSRDLWPNRRERMSARDYAAAEGFPVTPIGPANPPLWRLAILGGAFTALVVYVGIQLLPVAVEGIRTIVRAL